MDKQLIVRPSSSEGPLAGAAAWVLAYAVLVFGYTLTVIAPVELSDEGFHGPQVWVFFSGQAHMIPQLTVPPVYHAIIGTLMRQFDHYTVDLVRFFSMLGAALCLPAMHALVRQVWPDRANVRMVQCLLMPLAFPFFFLIYTDIWALAAVLGVLAASLSGRHWLAALIALLAIGLRPTAILWVGLAGVLGLHQAMYVQRERYAGRSFIARLLRGMLSMWPYGIPLAAFLAFVWWNGGVAIGDSELHQAGLNPTNLYMFLLCAWVLLLPWNLSALPDIVKLLSRPLPVFLVLAGFVLYMGSYAVTHPYNHPNMTDFMHNRVLAALTGSLPLRMLAFIPMAWMTLTLLTTRWAQARFLWILPFMALSVMLHPLIEQRYYLPALALLLALRPREDAAAEIALPVLYLPASAWLCMEIVTTKNFL